MSSWRGNFTTTSRQQRMSTLFNRVNAITLPPVTEICNKYVTAETTSDIVRDLEDRIFFSSFPEEDVSLSFSTLSMNEINMDGMKRNGAVGVLIEMLRRLPKHIDPNDKHVSDIIHCLYTMSEDVVIQRKILSNIYALPSILKLCVKTQGGVQYQLVQILERLGKNKNGANELADNNFFECFISPEMLHRESTWTHTQHLAASLINRISVIKPQYFLIEKFQSVCYCGLSRKIDVALEVVLLDAVLSHLTWLAGEGRMLEETCHMMSYLIEEIRKESFEDVNHLHQILRCILLLSREPKQIKFMLSNGLGFVLQYIVKTDFELWRKPIMTMKRGSRGGGSKGTKSSSALVLEAIRTVPVRASKVDEVNFKSTKYAVQIYENILEQDLSEISEIVTSGLISGMLFRVGRGHHIDQRFNRLVVHFVREILVLVSISQNQDTMALVASAKTRIISKHTKQKRRKFIRGDEVIKALQDGNVVEVSTLAGPEQKTDIRSVSTTLHSQGVTGLFLQCMLSAEDVELVSEAMAGLSLLYFQCIVSDICNEAVLGKICFYCLTRYDCFFPGLSLVCEVIYYLSDICRAAGVGVATADDANTGTFNESQPVRETVSPAVESARVLINAFIVDFNVITVLIKALHLSGWVFHMKGKVYRALARLARHPAFYDKVKKENGIPVLVFEHKMRKRNQRHGTRKGSDFSISSQNQTIISEKITDEDGGDDSEDEFTEELVFRLRRDNSCIKIQACCRTFLAKLRHRRLMDLLGKLKGTLSAP